MTLCRMIAPPWLKELGYKNAIEGLFTDDQIASRNAEGYNVYYWPNHPKTYDGSSTVSASQINVFNYALVDFDLKDSNGRNKDTFVIELLDSQFPPSRIVDSGNGIHAYWRVSDLDAKSYLRLSRRLMRHFNTDEAVGTLSQLMRLPGTVNTKKQDNFVMCEEVLAEDVSSVYTAEQLDALLPPISQDDERYCTEHYNRLLKVDDGSTKVDDTLPPKFGKLLDQNPEAKAIWANAGDDRSKGDYRLGHLMFANGFTKAEALSVLVNSAKAMQRSPTHRVGYAQNIVDKIWTYELAETKSKTGLSESVASILVRNDEESLKGRRFRSHPYFDGTEHGFRLSQVIGLCAGVGVGKTAVALNLFKGFVQNNPDYVHMFVSLEQPGREIAGRWAKMAGNDFSLHDKVHVLSNYNPDGSYRDLSLTDIQTYILEFQKETGLKVGCVCIDHIGVLRQEAAPGEYQGLRAICAQMKSFAVVTETLLIMQSQTNRDKAGIGDLELFKDAAYGTQAFESFVDFMLCCWQPLKRCYDSPECPRVTAYKFAKIRFKSKSDKITEDQCYRLSFDQETETLKPILQVEEVAFNFFATKALNLRKKDRKTDLVEYKSTPGGANGTSKDTVEGAGLEQRTISSNRHH